MMANSISSGNTPRLSQRAAWAGGQPISYLMHRALAHPELISLAAGFVDPHTLPEAATRQALDIIFSSPERARAALQYGTTIGYPPLRDAVFARQLEADGMLSAETQQSADQVIITTGSNQLLHLVGETLLDPGDIVLCAAPSYFVFLGTLANLGARSIGVATDADGIVPEALEAELSRLESAGELGRVKAIYCTSYFDNPSSTSVSLARRPQLVEIAKRWSRAGRIYLIEDAAYRELHYTCDDMPSLRAYDEDGQTVIVAGTFSKSFSPGIRVGWGILPNDLVQPLCEQKGNVDFGSPNMAQHLMHTVLDEGLFDANVKQLRKSYQTKMDAMLEAADAHLAPLRGVEWIRPAGGLYVWLTLSESIDTGTSGPLFDRATEAGVLYVPGEYCFPGEGPRKTNTIRLSFGAETVENIRQGTEALGRAIGQIG